MATATKTDSSGSKDTIAFNSISNPHCKIAQMVAHLPFRVNHNFPGKLP